jgi:hypothetical protein
MTSLEKVLIYPKWGDTWSDTPIRASYNPKEFTLEKGVQLAEIAIPGLDTPLLQFVRGQNEKLSLELFFDTTDRGMGDEVTSVTTETDAVYQLVKIKPETHAPPICLIVWGDTFPGANTHAEVGGQRRYGFQCVVESVRQQFTLFSPKGIPLRATLTLSLREYRPLEEQFPQQNPSSPDRTHGHVVQRGDTLSRIAGEFYRRPGEWRAIAVENGLDDPRRLAPGMILTVPPIR